MAPRQLRHRLWRNVIYVPVAGKSGHVLKVPRREAAHLRKFGPQVFGKACDNFAAPALLFLSCEDFIADRPIQLDQLGVDGALCLDLGLGYPVFKFFERLSVILGKGKLCRRHNTNGPASGSLIRISAIVPVYLVNCRTLNERARTVVDTPQRSTRLSAATSRTGSPR